jgi:hypothetical protein
MNTIAPPPAQEYKRLPPRHRALGVFLGLVGGGIANLAIGYSAFSFWTRETTFIPYSTSSPDFQTDVFKRHNPSSNPPVCIDHAVRTVPFARLKTTDRGRLTTEFCRSVWGGMGYAYQRRYLERKYRSLPGREGDLWERQELVRSEYPVGTRITDHFEVVERGDDKVGHVPLPLL